MLLLFSVLFGFAYVLTPVLTAFAWFRWGTSRRRRSRRTRLSVLSLATATLSLLLATVSLALSIHNGFLTLNPRLDSLYLAGLLISLVALGIGLAGARNPNPIRWRTPLIAFGILCLWFLAGSGT